MKSKIKAYEDIIPYFKDGMTIAVGGMANHGVPNKLIDCLLESGAKHLTTISLDSGDMNVGFGRLVHAGVIDKMYTTHIGKNPETTGLLEEGKIKIQFNPMGTLIERVRCGGFGLGGVLTKTGLGTVVENYMDTIEVDGEKYILAKALRADIALTRGRFSDPIGNVCYHGTNCNSNPIFAQSADLSIVEADFLVDFGEVRDDAVITPSNYVDIVLAQEVSYR